MPIDKDEISKLWQELWQTLWHKLFKAAWALGIILACIGVTEAALLFSLITVATNQQASIANQKAIAAAVEDGQRIMLAKQQEMLAQAKESSAAAREAAANAASAVAVAKTSAQAAVTTAATNAAIAVKQAHQKPSTRTIIERQITPQSDATQKKEAQLDAKNNQADATQKKLDSLVHQYKHAIKKVEHP
jgi:hypothetical protein